MSKSTKIIRTLIILVMAAATVTAIISVLSGNGLLSSGSAPDSENRPASVTVTPSDLIPDEPPAEPEPSEQLPEGVPEVTELAQSAQEDINEIFDRYELVAMQIAVIDDGYVTGVYSRGWADSEAAQPIDDNTKLRVASLTKVLVGMSAMRAQEEGCLSLDETLTDQLGYYVRNPNYTSYPLTMRNILTHTATIRNSARMYSSHLPNFLQTEDTYFSGHFPGTAKSWEYSNAGFFAAGGIVEVLTDSTMYSYAGRNFFEPLGIDATFHAQCLEDSANLAAIYHCAGSPSLTVAEQLEREYIDRPASDCTAFAGGLLISAQDYARLLCILLRDGEYDGVQCLSPETVAEMESVQFELEKFDQCIVLRHRDDLYGRELYYHTGAAYGLLALAAYDPAANEGFVILTTGSADDTRDDVGVASVCADLAQYLLDSVLDGKRAG